MLLFSLLSLTKLLASYYINYIKDTFNLEGIAINTKLAALVKSFLLYCEAGKKYGFDPLCEQVVR